MSRLRWIGLALASLATGLAVAAFAGSPDRGPAPPTVRLDCARYASPAGDEDAPGTRAEPFRTAQRLADSLRPGEAGCLRAGDYRATGASGYVIEFERPGRAGAPITIGSAPGERGRLIGTVVVTSAADHVRIAGVDIEGTGAQNTVKVYAADTVLEANDITNELRGESCVILGSSSAGRAVRPVVRRNVFHDCGAKANDNHDHGIYAAVVDDARIVDNTFSNSAALAIQLYPDSQRSYVARNVIDGGPDTIRGGIVVGGDARATSNDNVIEDNVIAYAATHSVYSFWEEAVGSGNVVRGNCTWKAGEEQDVYDAGGLEVEDNVVADPGFADRSRGDYSLDDDSPCRTLAGR